MNMFVCRPTASCQLPVAAFIGDAALLPCVYSMVDPLPETANVFWRDKDDSVLLDIKRRVPDFSTQNQKFRGRVSSDRELYRKGNFSVQMENVTASDSGPYECHIPAVNFVQKVKLSVTGQYDS